MARIVNNSLLGKVYFVAVSSADNITRLTGLTGFIVYRSRNGSAAVIMTTPTITEISAANMPGLYCLTVDEDTALDAAYDEQTLAFHFTAAGMQPVTVTADLVRIDSIIKIIGPSVVAVPRTGSRNVLLKILVRQENGALVDPTGNVVDLTWTADDGVTLPVGLPATATRLSTGIYQVTYSLASTADKQQRYTLLASATVGSTAIADYFVVQHSITQPIALNING